MLGALARRLASAPSRRSLSGAPQPPPPPPSSTGSLAHGLKHLRGETKAAAARSPLGAILGTGVVFTLAGGLGWALAQPQATAEQLSEAFTDAREAVKGLLPGGAKEE
ncbi:hypothetical protein KFE25_005631 [Diacronema lutheri]|uniref:Uncharacterized protein n=1 Tax=Diacronema lutheri TaxID=2081491 RepID=A0A8J5XC88_DIALT|nr:hypothetical protein KFE25_005631 [Diacronema lutheri]